MDPFLFFFSLFSALSGGKSSAKKAPEMDPMFVVRCWKRIRGHMLEEGLPTEGENSLKSFPCPRRARGYPSTPVLLVRLSRVYSFCIIGEQYSTVLDIIVLYIGRFIYSPTKLKHHLVVFLAS